MMRLAILSDIHGNPLALDAVLADIQAQGGVEGYWILGDFAAIGPDPNGVLERVTRLPDAHCTRGNTDRYVTMNRVDWATTQVQANPSNLARLISLDESLSWTQGVVTAGGWFDWLAALPLDVRVTLPDGTRVLGVHAAPGADDGDGMRPTMSDAELAKLLEGCEADLVFVGHTHWAQDRAVASHGARMVNQGSVSNPFPPDLRASYVLLEADERGYLLQHRRVDYDHEMVIDQLQKIRHPHQDYIIKYMRGENKPPWDET
jgi:predicted phosphodiesterase